MYDGRYVAAALLFCLWALGARAAPVIAWGPCPVHSRGAQSAAAMRCGWLRRDSPLAGQPLRLRVVVLRARPDARDPTPIVYLPGGPGEPAGLSGPALRAWRGFAQRAGWSHDIVLFDPRGTGASVPRPACTLDRGPAAERGQGGGAPAPLTRSAAAVCYARLGAATAAALGANAQLADLDALISALGVRQVNLWSISYATRLALLYVRRHPARVHAVALDSLVSLDRDERLALPGQIHRVLANLDRYCAARARCARRGAMPQTLVYHLLQRYAQRPPTVTGHDDAGRHQLIVTPYRLLMMLLYAGYTPQSAVGTIARLRQAGAGKPGALGSLAKPIWAQQRPSGRNPAVFLSTRCAFRRSRSRPGAWHDALSRYPRLVPFLAAARPVSVCDSWPVPAIARPAPMQPLPVPALVIAGSQDALTPPAWAARFAHRHPGAGLLRVAGAGHRPSFYNACAWRAMGRFWNAPTHPLPTRCAGTR